MSINNQKLELTWIGKNNPEYDEYTIKSASIENNYWADDGRNSISFVSTYQNHTL